MQQEDNSLGDDQLLAIIAHASIIILAVIAPLIIWLVKKDESEYVAYQAKQALAYQAAIAIISSAVSILLTVFAFATFGFGMILFFVLIPLFLIIGLFLVAYGFYGAYQCYLGKNFEYAIISDYI